MTHDPCRELNTTYCGFLAQQWWTDYLVWEKLLNAHPEIERIVEIGTGAGGFSLFLQDQAIRRFGPVGSFWTFDHGVPAFPIFGFTQLDVFVFPERVTQLLRHPMILHCDGGDKPREVRQFATRLLPGSLAVVHDYGVEFLDSDVPDGLRITHREITEPHGGLSVILLKL